MLRSQKVSGLEAEKKCLEQQCKQVLQEQEKLTLSLDLVVSEKKSLQEELEDSFAAKEALEKNFNQLTQTLEKNRKEQQESDLEKKQIEQKIFSLQKQLKDDQQQINTLTKEIQEKKAILEESLKNEKIAYLEAEKKIALVKKEANSLAEEKSKKILDLEAALQTRAKNREKAEQLSDSDSHQIKSLYFQLKKQFQDKSTVLDQTRQELFIACEKVLQLEKNLEEKEYYSASETEELLRLAYEELAKKYEDKGKEYEEEILHLHSIISHLIA